MKETYRIAAERAGIRWNGRRYDRQNPNVADRPNQALNHAASAVEGAGAIAVAATATIPQLGSIHEDSGQSFVLDVRGLVHAATQLSSVGKRTRKARAGDMGFTQVRRSIAEQTGIKQTDLVHGASGIRKQLATLGSFEYDVIAKSSHTPLSYFNPTQTAAGVSASPWGQRRVFQGAFMATVQSGHVGVWAHEAGPAQYARRVNASGHVYYSQANIRQLWGPSIAKEMVKEPTPAAFKKAVTDNFVPRLTHELERMIAAINPKASVAA